VVVFTGQGAQKTGMARDFVEAFPLAAAVFDEASEALDLDLRALCFEPDERLNLTAFTQPAILTAEVAMFAVAHTEWGYRPALFGGHSLGEYAALVAAGVLPLAEAVRLVAARGRLMQEAVPVGVGAMAALIGENLDLNAITAELADLVVDVANHNSPDQVVLSGDSADIDLAITRLSGPGRRGKKLVVSAPFHSRLMAPIEPAFADRVRLTLPALAEPDWTSPAALATLPRYRAAYGTDPGPYARSAFDAVLATAALKGIVLPGTLVPWSHRYVWSPVTGGHVHTGWRMVELCHGRWEDVEEGCVTE
jgi:[acyl-carrier-protein] S-malonyltransferase/trans-AT polyketide synthase/acyltransferase/oxidoreductase domain-containing protein